jgi:hypothetical protein
MQYLDIIITFIREQKLLEIIIVLSILFITIITVNIVLNYFKNKIKNIKLKIVIDLLKTPILITVTTLWMLFYINQTGILPDIFPVFEKIVKTLLFIYYLTLLSSINKMFLFPSINKVLIYKKVSKHILHLVDKVFGIIIFIIAIFWILSIWEINLTPLLASA